jgi:hypothetical protein
MVSILSIFFCFFLNTILAIGSKACSILLQFDAPNSYGESYLIMVDGVVER